MVILAAVGEDGDPGRIIDAAHELAVAFDDELQVLHVIPQMEAEEHFESLRSIDEFKDISIETEIDRAEEIATTLVDKTLEDKRKKDISAIGRIGDPADEIIATIESRDPRYVVIGGRKRTPTGKAVFGSVTQSVILNSESPTVTVINDI